MDTTEKPAPAAPAGEVPYTPPARPTFLLSVAGIASPDGFVAHPLVRVRHDTLYAIFGLYPIDIRLLGTGAIDVEKGDTGEQGGALLVHMQDNGASSDDLAAARAELVHRNARERVLTWLRAPEITAMLGFVSGKGAIQTEVVRIASAMLWGPLALRNDSIRRDLLPSWSTLLVKAGRKGAKPEDVTPLAADVAPETVIGARRVLSTMLAAMRDERESDRLAREEALAQQAVRWDGDGRDA